MPGGSARLIDLPVVSDPRGDLTFVEGRNHVPFDIARVYYLYNVPVDAERGGHAHKVLQQARSFSPTSCLTTPTSVASVYMSAIQGAPHDAIG